MLGMFIPAWNIISASFLLPKFQKEQHKRLFFIKSKLLTLPHPTKGVFVNGLYGIKFF